MATDNGDEIYIMLLIDEFDRSVNSAQITQCSPYNVMVIGHLVLVSIVNKHDIFYNITQF